MSVSVVIITIVAVGFALMGIAAFVRPSTIAAPLGLAAGTPDARNEVQAVYGGFGLAVAATLMLAQGYPQYRDGVILAVAASLAGMAAGRAVAAIRERPTRLPVIFFFIEAVAAVALYKAI